MERRPLPRYNPAMNHLSEAALCLLHRRLDRQHVVVDDTTRPLYRELAEAGLMTPLHTFAHGPDSGYRLTDRAVSEYGTRVPFAATSPAPRS